MRVDQSPAFSIIFNIFPCVTRPRCDRPFIVQRPSCVRENLFLSRTLKNVLIGCENLPIRCPDCVPVQSFHPPLPFMYRQSTFSLHPTKLSCHSFTVLVDLHPLSSVHVAYSPGESESMNAGRAQQER